MGLPGCLLFFFQELWGEISHFDPASPNLEVTHSLNLSQGSHPIIDYIIEFRTAAADSEWNDTALYNAFYRGLSVRLKDALASQTQPETILDIIKTITRLHNRFRELHYEKTRNPCSVVQTA